MTENDPDTMDKIRGLLNKHKYVVQAKKLADGCVVKLPKTIFYPSRTVAYRIKRGKKSGLHFNDSFVAMPEYAIRLMCLLDIYKSCTSIGYSHLLIEFVDKNNNPIGETDLIDGTISDEERIKESALMDIYIKVATEGVSDDLTTYAETHKVALGYRMLLEILGQTS